MTQPLVSVIVTTYNQEGFLAQALDSLKQQTYVPLQVIVVDDGSTDGTAAIANKYDVTYIFQENAGVIAAAEHALQEVRGEYVLRLDGDDWLPADFIMTLAACLQAAPPDCAFAYCDAEYEGTRTGRVVAGSYKLNRLVAENYIHVSALVRTVVIRECGYFSPTMRAGFEDWDFWLLLAEHGYYGVYCPEIALHYRQHAAGSRNSLSAAEHRALRLQIRKNHPVLYGRPSVKLAVVWWKLRRRLRRYLGLAG